MSVRYASIRLSQFIKVASPASSVVSRLGACVEEAGRSGFQERFSPWLVLSTRLAGVCGSARQKSGDKSGLQKDFAGGRGRITRLAAPLHCSWVTGIPK
jgi:hypothetical protein